LFLQGRINADDIKKVLSEDDTLQLDAIILQLDDKQITHGDIILAALLHSLKPVTHCQLTWQIEELEALERCQDDLNAQQRQELIQRHTSQSCQKWALQSADEAHTVSALWQTTLKVLDLEHLLLHLEDMVDMSADQAESMLLEQSSDNAAKDNKSLTHRQVQKESRQLLGQLLDRVGHDITLGGFIKVITDVDILDDIRPVLLRHIGSYLDQGMAAWHQRITRKVFI